MTRPFRMYPQILPTTLIGVLMSTATACDEYDYVEISSGFTILAATRPALADDGTVVAAQTEALIVGDGTTQSIIDLTAHGLQMSPSGNSLAVRSQGDIALLANRAVVDCSIARRGAYRLTTSGGPLTTLFENCPANFNEGAVGRSIDMALSGTVAFSQIRNGDGAIYRGPATGPVSILRSGTGEFYNTGRVAVNNAGRVTVQMEYFDGFAGGLMRGILAFDTPQQVKASVDTVVEKMGIGAQPVHAINNSGTAVFATNNTLILPIGNEVFTYEPGVYISNPTLFNTPKDLTLVADLSGDYCRFGAVDINDNGDIVFEAQLDDASGCAATTRGLYSGPAPALDVIVEQGDEGLGDHQFFDNLWLGEINSNGQISFTTSYSEPLVDPIKVWRADPCGDDGC